MARTNPDLSNMDTCGRCQSLYENGAEICPTCSAPTKFMSFKSRAEYEVEQWRRYKSDATAGASV
jgi:predicted amidophosphoribosyltransferase